MAKYCPLIKDKVLYTECLECDEKVCLNTPCGGKEPQTIAGVKIFSIDKNLVDSLTFVNIPSGKKTTWYDVKLDATIEYISEKTKTACVINTEKVYESTVSSIRKEFSGDATSVAVVEIDGSMPSTVLARMCIDAIGVNRVYGVSFPKKMFHNVSDIQEAKKYLEVNCLLNNTRLPLRNIELSISESLIKASLLENNQNATEECIANTARTSFDFIRKAFLLSFAKNINGKVVTFGNATGDFLGYPKNNMCIEGCINPLKKFTITEIKLLGKERNIPENLLNAVAEDDAERETCENLMGFSFYDLDYYLRTGDDTEDFAKQVVDAIKRLS